MTTTTYPHQDLMEQNKVLIADLSEKTQKSIAKFNEADDENILDSLDERIFNDIEDFLESRAKKVKEAGQKERHTAFKKKKEEEDAIAKKTADAGAAQTVAGKEPAKKKTDVSTAPTTAGTGEKSFVDRLFNR